MKLVHALLGFSRRTAEAVSDFASVIWNLINDIRDSYRPELHYMRGPGPKWRARHRQGHHEIAGRDWRRQPSLAYLPAGVSPSKAHARR
jgi:hypothetical protein